MKKALSILLSSLLLFTGAGILIDFGLYSGPGIYNVETSKRMLAVAGGLAAIAIAWLLLKNFSNKARYRVIGITLFLALATGIPIKTYKTGYGGCDIAPRGYRISMATGDSIDKAISRRKGCYSELTYKLYLL